MFRNFIIHQIFPEFLQPLRISEYNGSPRSFNIGSPRSFMSARPRSDAGFAGPATLNDKWFQSHTFCSLCSWVWLVTTNITRNDPSCGVWCEWNPQSIQAERTSFSLVCMNVLHHGVKKALCSMRVPKLWWMSTSSHLPVFTAVIKLSAFADAFERQSAKQFWVGMWARSWVLPEQASFRNIEIMWIVSFLFK